MLLITELYYIIHKLTQTIFTLLQNNRGRQLSRLLYNAPIAFKKAQTHNTRGSTFLFVVSPHCSMIPWTENKVLYQITTGIRCLCFQNDIQDIVYTHIYHKYILYIHVYTEIPLQHTAEIIKAPFVICTSQNRTVH